MEKYDIRNVANREIYDSYMGILRISPNEISPNNNKLIDDPTQHLNSILAIDPISKEGVKQMEIVLSDSDGNVLPITFIPKARKREMIYEGEVKIVPIINVVTKINEEAKLFVQNNFNSYSTIWLNNNEENKKDNKKISPLQIVSKTGLFENVLLYPVESPNDGFYFNDKNKCELVDYNSSVNKKTQMENSLLNRSAKWYEDKFSSGAISPLEKVKVGGKQVTTFNNDGETIPVLYTRDYVLGHYDGHSVNETNGLKDEWIGSESAAYNRTDLKGTTKLSWMRFDNLVWDVVDSIIKGEMRHTKGRYKKLGQTETDSIVDTLFDGGTCTLHKELNDGDWMSKTAPMLGHGVQEGLILYNAIPFHRYMFHVARQMCTNMSHQYKIDGGEGNWGENKIEGDKFKTLAVKLQNAKIKKILTPAPQGALSTIHSLCKDFLLCDGKEIKYENYPNMNISNDKFFEIDDNKLIPQPSEQHEFTEKTINTGVYNSIKSSNLTGKFETPHLYSILEDAPRFLRGLNWSLSDGSDGFDKKDDPIVSFDKINDTNIYYKNGVSEGNVKKINVSVDVDEKDILKDEMAMYSPNTIKNIKDVGLYFHNYDIKVKKGEHFHSSFSSENGLQSAVEESTPNEKINTTRCVNYVSGRKHGSKNYEVDHSTVLNHDMTYRVTGDNSSKWINYCFEKGNLNKYNGYAPIPNGGLYLFSKQLYNPKGSTSENIKGEYKGTTKTIEDNLLKKNYSYYDGERNEHIISPITSKKEVVNEFVRKINEIFGKSIKEATNDLDANTVFNNVNKAIADENQDEVIEIFKSVFSKHIEEKEKRRLQTIKMNESEGRIPASANGGPYYSSAVRWSREERRNIKKKKRKEKSVNWYGVGNYKISTNYEVDSKDFSKNYHYRCVTSVPYQNSSKLGVGDPGGMLKDNWYNKNSITIMSSDKVYGEVSYGGKYIDDKKMERGMPTPNYVNLLPLIRI